MDIPGSNAEPIDADGLHEVAKLAYEKATKESREIHRLTAKLKAANDAYRKRRGLDPFPEGLMRPGAFKWPEDKLPAWAKANGRDPDTGFLRPNHCDLYH